ncbi:MAG TPA: NHL repeat-containing protein [Chloroflexota bacterium]
MSSRLRAGILAVIVVALLAGSAIALYRYLHRPAPFAAVRGGPSAVSLAYPSGISADSAGNLYVSDTSNNRVLFYPASSNTATRVYGQPDSTSTAANYGGISASSLSLPSGVALDSAGNLYVADSGNNRVLVYATGSTIANRVYGQPDFASHEANNGGLSATSLAFPSGLAVDSSRNVFVADTDNNRVLLFPRDGTTSTRVYGQSDFSGNGVNAGGVSETSLSHPSGLAVDASGNLYVADSLNRRVLAYAGESTAASTVYGQPSFTSAARTDTVVIGTVKNNSEASATSLSQPSGVLVDDSGGLYVADTDNSRILFYPSGSTNAARVYGQPSLTSNTANNGGVSAASLSLPSGLALDGAANLYVTDSANRRVLAYPSGATQANRVVGQTDFTTKVEQNVGPGVISLARPASLAMDTSGNLFAADTANNRVLSYTSDSDTPARVYGQPDFTSKADNNGGIGPSSLSFPHGVAVDSSGSLYVADSDNSRVLQFAGDSTTAVRVYGQPGFATQTENNGGASASSLSHPFGVATDSAGNLYVADTSNNRVLFFLAGSATATRVYGQPNFTSNTANNGGLSATSLNHPNALAVDGSGNLYVADTSNHRALFFPADSTTAARVYGQPDFTSAAPSNGGVSASSLAFPRGVATDNSGNIYVADTSNNRVLFFSGDATTAERVYGQPDFTANQANNGTAATSLAFPSGVAVDAAGNLYVADADNNRIGVNPAPGSGG